MKKDKTKDPLNLYLDKNLIELLKTKSFLENKSVSNIVGEILSKALDKKKIQSSLKTKSLSDYLE